MDFRVAIDAIALRATDPSWRWSDLTSAIALQDHASELPGVVATLRRALTQFDPDKELLGVPLAVLRQAVRQPLPDPAIEESVNRWRGTKLAVGGREILVALAQPATEKLASTIADRLCLVVAVALGSLPEADALRTIADASRKARTEFVWGRIVGVLPESDRDFAQWVILLTRLDINAILQGLQNTPQAATRLFLEALVVIACRLGDIRPPRKRTVSADRELGPAPDDIALRSPPSPPAEAELDGSGGRPPNVAPSARSPQVGPPAGRVRVRRSPSPRTANAPGRRTLELQRSDVSEIATPASAMVVFEPDPIHPEEPPTSVPLLLEAADEFQVVQPTSHTQATAERGEVFRLLQLGAKLPWDWNHLNPHDLASMLSAIERDIDSPEQHPGALLAGVMLCTGTLLDHVAQVPVPASDCFVRFLQGPAKRWRGAGAEGLLEPEATEIRLQWPAAVTRLAAPWIAKRPHVHDVGNLLDLSDREAVRSALFDWLDTVRRGSLGVRLTHGRIARHLSMVLRAISGAEWAVYMLAATPEDVSPVSTYYTAISAEALAHLYNMAMAAMLSIPETAPPPSTQHQLMTFAGARIATDASMRRWIGHLAEGVRSARETTRSLVERHNGYALYTVWLLMAATGHRPVTDPFESIDTFDLDRGFVLVTDKTLQAPDQARIVPIGLLVREALSGWLDHLRRLSVALADPVMSRRLATVLAPRSVRSMPLFFLLQGDAGDARWQTIAASELKASLGTITGFTPNFFRRQLASMLARTDIPDELTRAAMGHEEGGIATHGRYSTRDPAELRKIGTLIDDWARGLGWQALPSPLTEFDAAGYRAPPPVVEPVVLGVQLRREASRQASLGATKEARAHLAAWLRNARRRGIDQRAVDELFAGIKRTAARGEQIAAAAELVARAHAHALHFASRSELEVKLPARSKAIRSERPAFRTGDVGQALRLHELRGAFVAVLRGRARSSLLPKFNRSLAECIASLAIHSLIGNPQVLLGLWRRPDFFLLHTEGLVPQLCIEYWISPDDPLPATTRRYPLHPASATLLARLPRLDKDQLNKHRPAKELRELVKEMHALTTAPLAAPRDHDASAVSWLATAASAEASLTLPAHVAAYMDGRTASVSVSNTEWRRLLGHEVPAGPPGVEPRGKFETDPSSAVSDPLAVATEVRTIGDEAKAKRLAQALHVGVRTILSRALGEAPESASPGAHVSKQKRNTQSALRARLSSHSGAPDLCRALVQWLVALLETKLRQSTCARYYFALALLIRDHAYDLRLDEASEENLSATYGQMMETAAPRAIDMVVGRLREFHSFLMETHGVATVDWGDVMPENVPDAFAPDASLVTPAQYRQAFELLRSDPTADVRERSAQTVLLLLHFRFGLRASEVAAMRRADLVHRPNDPSAWIVLVRNNEHRRIKSDAGIRQVPLLEPLDESEDRLLRDWASHAEEQASSDRLASLFNDLGRPRRLLDRRRTSLRIVEALRATTGNPRIRLHHLRHSYATRMTLLLSSVPVPTSAALEIFDRIVGDANAAHVQQVLLGRPGTDGRSLWALAGIMGHASPGTTLRWYVHMIDLLAACSVAPVYDHSPVTLAGFEESYWLGYATKDRSARTALDHRVIKRIADHRIERIPLHARRLEAATLAPRAPKGEQRPGPPTVDRVLDVAFRSGRIDGVASAVMCDAEGVGEILQTDLKVRKHTGYDVKGARWTATEATTAVRHRRTGTRDAQETYRIRPFLHELARRLVDPQFRSLTLQVCTLWQERFRTTSTPLLVRSEEEMRLVVHWLTVVNVDGSDIVITTVQGEELGLRACDEMSTRLRQASWLSHARAQHHATGRGRMGVQVRRNKDGPISSMAALHRIFHVLSIWLRHVEILPHYIGGAHADE